MDFQALDGETEWKVAVAPEQGAELVAGETYTEARSVRPDGTGPYLSFQGPSGWCAPSSGSFVIDQLGLDGDGRPLFAALRFEYRCGDSPFRLTGSLAWRAPQAPLPPPGSEDPKPGPVTGLVVRAKDPETVVLRWTDPSDADYVATQVHAELEPPKPRFSYQPWDPLSGAIVGESSGGRMVLRGLLQRYDYGFSVFSRDASGQLGRAASVLMVGTGREETTVTTRPGVVNYTIRVKPRRTMYYRATFMGNGNLLGSRSSTYVIKVRP